MADEKVAPEIDHTDTHTLIEDATGTPRVPAHKKEQLLALYMAGMQGREGMRVPTRLAVLTLATLALVACERKPSDRALCKKHDHAACVRWMDYYVEMVDHYSGTQKGAGFDHSDELLFTTAIGRACFKERDPKYCKISAKAHTYGRYGLRLNKQRAVASHEMACRLGEQQSCLAAHDLYTQAPPIGIGPLPEKARAALELGCDEEKPLEAIDVCSRLGGELREREDPKESKRVERLRRAICAAEDLSATNSVALACLDLKSL